MNTAIAASAMAMLAPGFGAALQPANLLVDLMEGDSIDPAGASGPTSSVSTQTSMADTTFPTEDDAIAQPPGDESDSDSGLGPGSTMRRSKRLSSWFKGLFSRDRGTRSQGSRAPSAAHSSSSSVEDTRESRSGSDLSSSVPLQDVPAASKESWILDQEDSPSRELTPSADSDSFVASLADEESDFDLSIWDSQGKADSTKPAEPSGPLSYVVADVSDRNFYEVAQGKMKRIGHIIVSFVDRKNPGTQPGRSNSGSKSVEKHEGSKPPQWLLETIADLHGHKDTATALKRTSTHPQNLALFRPDNLGSGAVEQASARSAPPPVPPRPPSWPLKERPQAPRKASRNGVSTEPRNVAAVSPNILSSRNLQQGKAKSALPPVPARPAPNIPAPNTVNVRRPNPPHTAAKGVIEFTGPGEFRVIRNSPDQ